MTEPIEPTPATEPDDDDEPIEDMRAFRRVRNENARLRREINDAREQLGAAAAREAVHHRAIVEATAKAAGLFDPSDFLAAHPDVSEFIDDEFHDVVPDRVAEAAAALLASKPYLGRPAGPPPSDRPLEGLRSGASAPEDQRPAPSWSALRGGA